MALIFVDGVPGTGKSALCTELVHRGEYAYDMDDECIMLSKQTGQVVEYAYRKNDPYDWVYPRNLLEKHKVDSRTKNIFLFGSIDNFDEVRAAADDYVWMEINIKELLKRLAERQSKYGKSESERRSIVKLFEEMDAMGHPKAFKLDATKSIKQMADELLTHARNLA